MKRNIITYPSKRLYLTSEPITSFNGELHALLDDMYETMIDGLGVGLAAIQVDVPVRAFLVNIPDENDEQKKENLYEIINPELEFIGDENILFTEGCLSIPGFFEEVMRKKNVALTYFNRFGQKQILEASDFLAVAIQHEFDHLNGHLFIEKLSYTQRQKFQKEYKEQLKALKKEMAKNGGKPLSMPPIKSSKQPPKSSKERIKSVSKELNLKELNSKENSKTSHATEPKNSNSKELNLKISNSKTKSAHTKAQPRKSDEKA